MKVGSRHRNPLTQAGAETAGSVLDQVGRKNIGEQLSPCRIRRTHHDVDRFAAAGRVHVVDHLIARGIDHTGNRDHLLPQVAKVFCRNGSAVRPLGFVAQLVANRERGLRRHFSGNEERIVDRPLRRARLCGRIDRAKRTGQYEVADCGVDRRLIREQVRVESASHLVDCHSDLLHRRNDRSRCGLDGFGALDRRRRIGCTCSQ